MTRKAVKIAMREAQSPRERKVRRTIQAVALVVVGICVAVLIPIFASLK